MNFDDSQLSAFLDEELDPGDHLLVAWNVESSPDVARQLAGLRSSRDAVAGLDRPAIPRDLSVAVLADIAHWQDRRRRRSLTRIGRTVATVVGAGAVAASLLFALILLYRPLHDDTTPRLFAFGSAAPARNHPNRPIDLVANSPVAAREAQNQSSQVAESNPPPLLARANRKDKSSEPARVTTDAGSEAMSLSKSTASASPVVAVVNSVEGPDPARPGQVDAMLGHRKVLRALIVTDVLDQTSRRVRNLIEQDAAREPEFGRISLAQGVVIDPTQPGEAEVYTVVMTEPSSGPFLSQLKRAFPGIQIETEADSATIAHLSEVGQVAVFSGVRPADLGLPPIEVAEFVATKGAPSPDQIHLPRPDPFDAGAFQPDQLAQARTEPEAIARRRNQVEARIEVESDKQPTPDEPVTVLVWVTRKPQR